MLTLHYAAGTCALASHILLEQTGARYDAVRMDFASNAQRSPEFLRLNPTGRVPTLVTERGVLTETPAILLYLCQTFPQAGLASVLKSWPRPCACSRCSTCGSRPNQPWWAVRPMRRMAIRCPTRR